MPYAQTGNIKTYYETQLKISQNEMIKIVGAAYNFKQLPLETIKVPTLIVLDENERKSVFPHAEKMIELIPDSRKIIVPDAGHVSNLENPEFFNRELDCEFHRWMDCC